MKIYKKVFTPVLCIAFAFIYKITDDIITRLGMQEQNAQWHIIRNFIGRFDTGPMEQGTEDGPANSIYKQLQSFKIPSAKLLPAIISGDKAGAAKELCEYVKKYVNSVEFGNEYIKLREDAMPLQDQGQSLAQMKRNQEIHQKNINNYKTDTKYVAEQQQRIDDIQKRIDAMLKTAKTNFPGKAAWLKLYPEDPAIMIKARLQEYLQLAATVDFTAKLSGTGKKQIFTNTVYEKKSLKWKAIYRAGKDVNDVVTAFVKDWLKGEIIAKDKTAISSNTPTSESQIKKEQKIVSTNEETNNRASASAGNINNPTVAEEKGVEKKPATKKLKEKLSNILRN